jgi:hypothetical protein
MIFFFHHQFNLSRESVLTSSSFNVFRSQLREWNYGSHYHIQRQSSLNQLMIHTIRERLFHETNNIMIRSLIKGRMTSLCSYLTVVIRSFNGQSCMIAWNRVYPCSHMLYFATKYSISPLFNFSAVIKRHHFMFVRTIDNALVFAIAVEFHSTKVKQF